MALTTIDSPILVFTTFWDANVVVRNGCLVLPDGKTVEVKKENVFSIALACPQNDKVKYICPLDKLKFLCPTYDMLVKYKEDKEWEEYSDEYTKLLEKRNDQVESWLNDLSDSIYVLCCWENTSKNAKCHRSLLFDMLKEDDRVLCVYRHGHENKRSCESSIGRTHNQITLGNQQGGPPQQMDLFSSSEGMPGLPGIPDPGAGATSGMPDIGTTSSMVDVDIDIHDGGWESYTLASNNATFTQTFTVEPINDEDIYLP